MRRVALLVVALALLSPLSAAALQAEPVAQTGGNATANGSPDVAPGARLAGVVGSQGARIDGEVEQRAFSVRLERANSTDAKAATVAAIVGQTNATVDDLQAGLDELRAAREAGNVTESTYRARVTVLAQRIASTRELANRSAEAAADIPVTALRERGVSAAAARNLSRRAAELGGQEVAAIARNVTGRTNPPRAGRAGGAGLPDAGSPNRTVPGGQSETLGQGAPGANGSRGGSEADRSTGNPPNREAGGNRTADNGARTTSNGNPSTGTGAENASGAGEDSDSSGGNATDTPPEAGENAERNRSA